MFIKHSPERVTVKGYKRNDCTVNAIGSALGLSYDLARKVLQTAIFSVHEKEQLGFVKKSPRTKVQFTRRTHVVRLLENLCESSRCYVYNEELQRHYKHRKPGTLTLQEFADKNKDGVYIVLVRGHLVSVVNGEIIDTWDSSKKVVEISFKMDVKKARKRIMGIAKFYKMTSKDHIVENHLRKLKKSA